MTFSSHEQILSLDIRSKNQDAAIVLHRRYSCNTMADLNYGLSPRRTVYTLFKQITWEDSKYNKKLLARLY